MITLLCVVGDSEVRAKDTEVGKGTPLTSPFIEEGICGADIEGSIRLPTRPDSSTRSLRSLGRNDRRDADGTPDG